MDILKLQIQDIQDSSRFLAGLRMFLLLHKVTANGVLRIGEDPESGQAKMAITILNNMPVIWDFQKVKAGNE